MKNEKGVSIIVFIIIIAIILCAVFVFMNNGDSSSSSSSNLNVVVTKDNYNTIGDMFDEDEDELYYLTYACLYYSITERLTTGEDEDTAMQKIYGKTVQELVDEGKELMKKYNITVEEYKSQLNN